MYKFVASFFLLTSLSFAGFSFKISDITPNIKQRMIQGNSYREGCPVKLRDLNYLKLTYIDFNGKEKEGELIVNKAITKDVINIFKKLYKIKYPIHNMRLVSNYKASDFASIEADNTSAFNCRFVDGTHKWSNHSYGRAIDINPIENPYVSNSGHTSHKKSKKYISRYKAKGVLLSNDKVVNIFKSYGFRWGGDWSCCKDYQHFDKKN